MILVRNIFQIKFGRMREALDLWKEGRSFFEEMNQRPFRLLTDLTGQFYTLVMESEYENLEEFERGFSDTTGADKWRNWYKRFGELVESGHREVYTVVDQPRSQFTGATRSEQKSGRQS